MNKFLVYSILAAFASSQLTVRALATINESNDDKISTLPTTDSTYRPSSIPCSCKTDNSTLIPETLDSTTQQKGASFLDGVNSFLSSVLLAPISHLLNTTASTTRRTTEEVRNQYDRFTQFLKKYQRSYSAQELPKRFNLFIQRLSRIEQSMRDYAAGKSSYELAINKFTDMDDAEMKVYLNLKTPSEHQLQELLANATSFDEGAQVQAKLSNTPQVQDYQNNLLDLIPFYSYLSTSENNQNEVLTGDSKDWTQTGCFGQVANQGSCGSCYAWATIGVVEAQQCISSGTPLKQLSPQEIVDCSTNYGANNGCDGGWPTDVFRYLRDRKTVSTANCYQYTSKKDFCKRTSMLRSSGCTVSAAVKNSPAGSFKLLRGEAAMKQHLMKTGPLVGVVEVRRDFMMYSKGVFEDRTCSKRATAVSHGAIIAGFGEEKGKKYWLIKNFWSSNWGEQGYMKLRRGTNECSIESLAWGIPV